MKKMKYLLAFIIISITCLIYTSEVYAAVNYRDDGNIELYAEDLVTLPEEDISKVVQITIKNSLPNSTIIYLIQSCSNLETLYIEKADGLSLRILNTMSNNKRMNIYVLGSNIDLEGLNNNSINSLNIAISNVENIKQIEKLTTLKTFGYSESSGYEKIDFSKIPDLESLSLTAHVDDFEELIDSIPNVTSLSLAGTNIQNKDTQYLKELTNLTYLNLNQTYLTDIDFVENLTNLEQFILPWAVTDLSPIYSLNKLNRLEWEAYTELFVTQELVNYLDANNIWHYEYNSNINTTINNILDELNIDEEPKLKKKLEKISRYIVENTTDTSGSYSGDRTSLDTLIKYNQGVCYHHSIALYTLAKAAGIEDIYGVSGYMSTYTNKYTGEDDGNLWGRMAHAWNIVYYNGRWYSIDAAQMNNGTGNVDDFLFTANFWKNPLKDDDYSYDYAINNYLDFNYFFSKSHIETDGTINQIRTYQLSNVTGLDIKNHTIYNYDASDSNASNFCSRVLDNYTCTYQDKDNSNSITTGDLVVIKKDSTTIETFTLSTEEWVEEKEPHLGGITFEYTDYPDKEINWSISTLYYNKKHSLSLKIKGENYDDNTVYETLLQIMGENLETPYSQSITFTGKEINNGLKIEIPSGLLKAKNPPSPDDMMGSIQYVVLLNIDGTERISGFDYIEEGSLPEQPTEEKKEEAEENPETSDIRHITLILLTIITTIAFLKAIKKFVWLK